MMADTDLAFTDSAALIAEAKADGVREGLRAAADMVESIALSIPETETGWRVVLLAVDALRRAANKSDRARVPAKDEGEP